MTDLSTGTTEPRTVADVLERAADYIEGHGWTQGMSQDPNGCLCALGGINLAACGDAYGVETPEAVIAGRSRRWLISASVAAVTRRIDNGALYPDELRLDLASWNDAPERTAGEVVAKLREVAAEERAS